MKVTCFVLFALGLAALATADDSGFFVPKAFYKLDNEGHKSDVVQINPHEANILRRLRRQVVGGSSSSSSSTYGSNDGGPVYFSSHQTVQQTPGFQSRFGGDDDEVTGHAIHTTGVIQDGRVVYKTSKTSFL